MIEIHYGVVQIGGQWMVISEGLRSGPYATAAEADEVARRMADQASGLAGSAVVQTDGTGETSPSELKPGGEIVKSAPVGGDLYDARRKHCSAYRLLRDPVEDVVPGQKTIGRHIPRPHRRGE